MLFLFCLCTPEAKATKRFLSTQDEVNSQVQVHLLHRILLRLDKFYTFVWSFCFFVVVSGHFF